MFQRMIVDWLHGRWQEWMLHRGYMCVGVCVAASHVEDIAIWSFFCLIDPQLFSPIWGDLSELLGYNHISCLMLTRIYEHFCLCRLTCLWDYRCAICLNIIYFMSKIESIFTSVCDIQHRLYGWFWMGRLSLISLSFSLSPSECFMH